MGKVRTRWPTDFRSPHRAHRPGMAPGRGRERHREREHRRLPAVARRLLRGARHERRRPRLLARHELRRSRRARRRATTRSRSRSTAPASSRFAPRTARPRSRATATSTRRRAQAAVSAPAPRSTRRSPSRTTSTPTGVSIAPDGTVTAAGRKLGQLTLVDVPAPDALAARSDGLLAPTAASGAARRARPPRCSRASLEQSNVDLATALTEMMDAQRDFQLASRALHTQDQLLEIANGIRR